jgi:hypothetical protein
VYLAIYPQYLMVRSAVEFIIGPRFARTRWRVSNHLAQRPAHILRDAAKWSLLRIRFFARRDILLA